MWNPQFLNPSLSGSADGIRSAAAFRYQWTGFEGAPVTLQAGVDMPLPLKRSSAGLFLMHDRVGAIALTQVQLAYAYSQPLGTWKLNAGVFAGFSSASLDGNKIITPEGSNSGGVYNPDDPFLPSVKVSSIRPDISIGISAMNERYYAGIAVQNLANFSHRFQGFSDELTPDYGRFVSAQAGAKFNLNDNFSLEPTFLVKSDLKNTQIDISLLATYKNIISLGIGSRGYNKNSFESLIGLLSVRVIKGLNFGYSFDGNFGTLAKVSNGSHELSLSYVIPKNWADKKVKVINHPRFL